MPPNGPCLTLKTRIVPILNSHTMPQQQRPPEITESQHTGSVIKNASIGSPNAVPVPCASNTSGPSPPSTVPRRRRYEEPFGAVKLALDPSCCTADPGRTTSPKKPCKKESTLSPRQYPSAQTSNVWQRPYGESMPAVENTAHATCSK